MTDKQRIILDTCMIFYSVEAQFKSIPEENYHQQARRCVTHAFNTFDVCWTQETLWEMKSVVRDTHGLRGLDFLRLRERMDYLKSIEERSTKLQDLPVIPSFPLDDRHNAILAAANSANAAYLLTFDEKLWRMGRVGSTLILRPAQYLATIAVDVPLDEELAIHDNFHRITRAQRAEKQDSPINSTPKANEQRFRPQV